MEGGYAAVCEHRDARLILAGVIDDLCYCAGDKAQGPCVCEVAFDSFHSERNGFDFALPSRLNRQVQEDHW